MSLHRAKITVRQSYPFYLAGMLFIFGMKYFYRQAACDALTWILTPTTLWVSVLSGIPFTYESGSGYVNHSLRYVIAPSCCGVQFLIITFATLLFSFVHRMETRKKGLVWTALCLVFSYLYTVFINGLRIMTAIVIPLLLNGMAVSGSFLTPERLHTLIGTAVYFTALLFVYHPADVLSLRIASPEKISTCRRKYISPVFWYFFIVLGLPFLNRAYRNNSHGFFSYAVLITCVCLSLLCLSFLLSFLLSSLVSFLLPFLPSSVRKRLRR